MYGALVSLLNILKKLLCPLPVNVALTNGFSGAPKVLVPNNAPVSPNIEGVAAIIPTSVGCNLSVLS